MRLGKRGSEASVSVRQHAAAVLLWGILGSALAMVLHVVLVGSLLYGTGRERFHRIPNAEGAGASKK